LPNSLTTFHSCVSAHNRGYLLRSRYDCLSSFAPGQAPPIPLLLLLTIHRDPQHNSAPLCPEAAHPSQSSRLTESNILLSKHLRMHRRFTPANREPSSTNANLFLATPTKICPHCPSTRAHTRPSQEQCRPLTAPSFASLGQSNSIPSIFLEAQFGRYVITRFLADANLHGHRPTVSIRLPSYNPLL